MTQLLVAALPGNESFAVAVARHLNADVVSLETRKFPDGESYLRFCSDIAGCDIAVVCTLDHPNEKLVSAYLAAATARDVGARRVGLVAPYLGYMRQDKRFKPGEAISSRHVASLLSSAFHWMVTVDPHLHRYHALGEIYTVPTRAVHVAPLLAKWDQREHNKPVDHRAG